MSIEWKNMMPPNYKTAIYRIFRRLNEIWILKPTKI